MSEKVPHKLRTPYRAIKVSILAALGIAFLAAPAFMREVTQFNALNTRAESLLNESIDRNLVTFVSLSAIKAVVGIVEGSTVGVGFELEVGDLVQPAYDYLDFVWTLFLYALMTLSFYKLLMETGLLSVGFALIGAGLLLGAFAFLSPPARRWARFLMRFGIVVSYVVPASLLGAQYVSDTYLVNVKDANAARIESVRGEFSSARNQVFELREKLSILNPGDSFDAVRTDATAIANRLSDAVWDSMFAFLTFVLILLVELVVLPLLTAYVLYKSVEAMAKQAISRFGSEDSGKDVRRSEG